MTHAVHFAAAQVAAKCQVPFTPDPNGLAQLLTVTEMGTSMAPLSEVPVE